MSAKERLLGGIGVVAGKWKPERHWFRPSDTDTVSAYGTRARRNLPVLAGPAKPVYHKKSMKFYFTQPSCVPKPFGPPFWQMARGGGKNT